MKRTFFFILSFLLVTVLTAQTPSSFRYQAVARNSSGNLLGNQNVSFRISILNGSASGTVAYRETHTGKTTNAFGLVEIEIGKGTPVTGTFSAINWGSNTYFVQVEMDAAGGTSYQTLNTSQLLSVPYALHAKTVETGDNWGSQTVNSNSTITGNGTVSTPLGIADNGVTSSKIQNGAVTADKLGSNSVTEAKIAAGAVTGAKIAQGGATVGQTLKWNGTSWAPGNDGLGGLTLPFEGTALTTEQDSYALKVSNSGTATGGAAITGHATATTGLTRGVIGRSDSPDGRGVQGYASSKTGRNYGVIGFTDSSDGSAAGVYGSATSSTGATSGVEGYTGSTQGTAVYGYAGTSSGATFGVRGHSASNQGTGVYGFSSAPTGSTSGVQGRSASPNGVGVFGTSDAATGSAWGIFGSSGSTSGRAIGARAYSTTGTTYGIHSQVISNDGFSGYFTGGKFYVSGNVGIGTETPDIKVHIKPSAAGDIMKITHPTTNDYLFRFRQSTSNGSGAFYVYDDAGVDQIFLFAEGNSYIKGGNLGIGTAFPTERLIVYGNAGKTVGGTVWLNSSDLRLKNVLGDYNKGLEEIALLQTVRYKYKKDNQRQLDSNEEQIGFVAQEVQKIFPEAVSEGADGYLDFNMHPINVALVNAIKELKAENDRLKAENEKVNTRLEKIEALLNTTVKD